LHEFSIAQSIVDSVVHEAVAKHASRVREISIEVGQLMQIDSRILKSALNLLRSGPLLDHTRIQLHPVKARFSCRRCGNKWTMNETKRQLSTVSQQLLVREPNSRELPLHFLPYFYNAFLRCVKCGSTDFEVSAGKEIMIRRVVME